MAFLETGVFVSPLRLVKTSPPPPASEEEPPGLPGFRSWRGVYGFVLIVFAAVVVGLKLFSRYFS